MFSTGFSSGAGGGQEDHEVKLHGVGVGEGQRGGGARAAGGADGAEQVGALGAPGRRAGGGAFRAVPTAGAGRSSGRSAPRPPIGSGQALEPDLDGLSLREAA